jgi:hypothetical protein
VEKTIQVFINIYPLAPSAISCERSNFGTRKQADGDVINQLNFDPPIHPTQV